MLVYHGTNEQFLPKIRKSGLVPRAKRKGNWERFQSRNDMIYLTTTYPFYFSLCNKGTKRAMVVEVDAGELDIAKNMFPDEDFLHHNLKVGEEKEKNKKAKSLLELNQHLWIKSLELMGTCCHKGSIPVHALRRICLFDITKRPLLGTMFYDANISPMNFLFCGERYRGCVAWMFGDRPDIPSDNFMDDSDFGKQRRLFWEKESENRYGIEVIKI